MKFYSKFDPGYTFWVPRVINVYEKDEIIIDNNKYERTIKTLDILARHKIIVSVNITATKTHTNIIYKARNVLDGDVADDDYEFEFATIYSEDEMVFTNRDDALAFARHWREINQCEYYGPITQD